MLLLLVAPAFVAPPPLPIVPPRGHLLPATCATPANWMPRATPPSLMERDPDLQQRLDEMAVKNQRNGAIVLGAVVAVCVWLFSVPPDIRRTNICELTGGDAFMGDCMEFSALSKRVASHYETCGADGAPPCVQFDFSIDPRKRAAFDAQVGAVLQAIDEPTATPTGTARAENPQ